MNKENYCETKAYCWDYRFELVGLILLVIATFLTIITLSGLGIAAMFIVGMVFCGHRYFSCKSCHPVVHDLDEEFNLMSKEEVEVKPKRPRKMI